MPRRERAAKREDIPEATGGAALVYPGIVGAIAFGIMKLIDSQGWAAEPRKAGAAPGVALLPAYLLVDFPRRYALALACVYAASFFYAGPYGHNLLQERNFFGTVRVTVQPLTGWHQLIHGTTVHGRQKWENGH